MPTSGSAAASGSPNNRRKGGQQDESEAMSATAALWLHELPDSVRPKKTCAQFPRIVNRIASLWGDATACGSYFNELLLDRRGDRQGFPMEIAFELAAVKNFFETAVHPSQQTIWDDIIQRGRAK
mgnify:CR=1 FL=1